MSRAFFIPLFFSLPLLGQSNRPIPYPVFTTPQFDQAVANGTRTTTGHPGANYWMNEATYDLAVRIDTTSKMLNGSGTIRYLNLSPDTLSELQLHLRQNIYRPGAMRNRFVGLTGGMQLSALSVNGVPIGQQDDEVTPPPSVMGTVMFLPLAESLAPGEQVEVAISWFYEIPAHSFRQGHDGEVYFIAYWYPQLAVHDDLNGWHADQYLGNGEFYMDWADYRVSITAPAGMLITSTGQLLNPEEVLSDQTRSRLAEAASGDEIVHVVAEEDRVPGISTATSDSGWLTWDFEATKVRDFVFGLSDKYLWDATNAEVGDLDGDGEPDRCMIHSFFRPDRQYWYRSAEYVRFSIEDMSRRFFPYPWPHMTAIEGLIGGGMEYPMMTLIGSGRSARSLFSVTYHETAHMWFPMIVGPDEKRYRWMEEGLTSFNDDEGSRAFYNDESVWDPEIQSYYSIAGTGYEVEPDRHTDLYPFGTGAMGIAGYNKPSIALHALRGLFGEEAFRKAYREYALRWAYKHPVPFDFFNTFEDVLGQDLDWFWTSLFYETWTLDQAIADVDRVDESIRVHIKDEGLTPMPAPVTVTYADGTSETKTVPVDLWLAGERATVLYFPPGDVQSVEIDAGKFLPDVDRSNNVWPREEN
jgi:hypothetical protein